MVRDYRTGLQSPAPPGVAGKVFASLVFLVFFCAGAFFVWLIAKQTLSDIHPWSWKATPCEIVSSSVRTQEKAGEAVGDFEFAVNYRYSFAGQAYTSERCHRAPAVSSDYTKMAKLVEKYPAGSHSICYVNPNRRISEDTYGHYC